MFGQKVLGPDHPHVATTLNDLAVLYNDQGKYEDAEKLFLQVLDTRKQTLGQGASSCRYQLQQPRLALLIVWAKMSLPSLSLASTREFRKEH